MRSGPACSNGSWNASSSRRRHGRGSRMIMAGNADRENFRFWSAGLFTYLAAALAIAPAAAQPLDKVSFGTNWVAEAEHGGFYQAVADGTYRAYRLDVTIVPGGPNVNNRILVPVGKLDF